MSLALPASYLNSAVRTIANEAALTMHWPYNAGLIRTAATVSVSKSELPRKTERLSTAP